MTPETRPNIGQPSPTSPPTMLIRHREYDNACRAPIPTRNDGASGVVASTDGATGVASDTDGCHGTASSPTSPPTRPKGLSRSTPLRRTGGLKRTAKIKPINVAKAKQRDARYKVKLAAYRASETYKVVAARAGGRCEFILSNGERCPETEGLQHCHDSYFGFGGMEQPHHVRVGCEGHHHWDEATKNPHRRHGRIPKVA